MYDNIGEKIKSLAKSTFIVEAIAAVIAGLVLLSYGEWWGVLILLCGPIVAWVSSWLLYGFGELIDKICDIEQNTRGGESKTKIKETIEKAKKEAMEKAEKEAMEKAEKEAMEKAEKEAAERAEKEAMERVERESAKKVKIVSSDTKYAEVICPKCREKLYFDKQIQEAKCPYCECYLIIE